MFYLFGSTLYLQDKDLYKLEAHHLNANTISSEAALQIPPAFS